MIAIREVQEVTSREITISLPADFAARRVEIISLPLDEVEEEREPLQRLLLNAPTLTDDELAQFANVREWMDQWSVADY